MEIADEEFLTDDTAEKDVSREAWPIPPANSVKDFEVEIRLILFNFFKREHGVGKRL